MNKAELVAAMAEKTELSKKDAEAAQCIRKLEREDAKTVPIIAMTANAFADDEERSLAAGMDAHISKPLDAEKLIQVISDICKKRKEHAKGDADI